REQPLGHLLRQRGVLPSPPSPVDDQPAVVVVLPLPRVVVGPRLLLLPPAHPALVRNQASISASSSRRRPALTKAARALLRARVATSSTLRPSAAVSSR